MPHKKRKTLLERLRLTQRGVQGLSSINAAKKQEQPVSGAFVDRSPGAKPSFLTEPSKPRPFDRDKLLKGSRPSALFPFSGGKARGGKGAGGSFGSRVPVPFTTPTASQGPTAPGGVDNTGADNNRPLIPSLTTDLRPFGGAAKFTSSKPRLTPQFGGASPVSAETFAGESAGEEIPPAAAEARGRGVDPSSIAFILGGLGQAAAGRFGQEGFGATLGRQVQESAQAQQFKRAMTSALAGEDLDPNAFTVLTPEQQKQVSDTRRTALKDDFDKRKQLRAEARDIRNDETRTGQDNRRLDQIEDELEFKRETTPTIGQQREAERTAQEAATERIRIQVNGRTRDVNAQIAATLDRAKLQFGDTPGMNQAFELALDSLDIERRGVFTPITSDQFWNELLKRMDQIRTGEFEAGAISSEKSELDRLLEEIQNGLE